MQDNRKLDISHGFRSLKDMIKAEENVLKTMLRMIQGRSYIHTVMGCSTPNI